ncbi:hypothetical protein [Burkholderia ubonensis]|uniref:hypothetical protein n=1 Tax=Burkholderia ubonensis TaxID=101571 RepID=UPI0012FAB577|nr:hypothetical protein [Burkholderia ubonensis]
MPTNSTLDYLESLWPRQALVSVLEAGKCLSYAPQTTRNKLAKDQFPVPTVLVGGKRLVKKTELARYIDELGIEKKRRGRPTKAAVLARERGDQ